MMLTTDLRTVGNKLTVTEVAVGSMAVTGVTVSMTVATVAVLIVTVPGSSRGTDTRLNVTVAVETGTRGMLLTTDLRTVGNRITVTKVAVVTICYLPCGVDIARLMVYGNWVFD
jgi:hypothetical protein